MFGHTAPEEPVEIVSYRLRGIGRVPPVKLPSYRRQGLALKDALRETRKARFGGMTLDCPVYQRDRLDVGVTLRRSRHRRSARRDDGRSARTIRPRRRVQEHPDRREVRVMAANGQAKLGAIDIEIVKASLSGIVQEMQNSLFRTGFSTIVRESQDASCAIMDARGDVIAQHVVLPLHMGAFPACCGAVINTYRGDIEDGDAYLINHPYEGGSPHAPDMAVITPVFVERELIGFCGSIAHKSDIGGPGARLVLGPGARDLQRRPASSRGALSPRRPAQHRDRADHRRQSAARPSSCSATSAARSARAGLASSACAS